MENQSTQLLRSIAMKKQFFFLSLLFFHFTFICEMKAQEDWFGQNPLPQGNTLRGVSFSDADNGTAVGNNGTISRTTDGGHSWVIQESGSSEILRDVSFAGANNTTVVEETGNSWFSNGPNGGSVNCVSVSKSNSDIVYIGTKQGVYKSENKGASWIKTGFRDFEVRSIKVSPSSPDVVFAGSYRNGIWRTMNGGVDWVFMRLSDNTINCIVIDPNNPNTIYFGSGESMTQTNGERIGVFRSTDGGEIFDPLIEWTNDDYVNQINSIFIDPDNSDHIYVARDASSNRGSFLYSTDGGTSWINKRMTTLSSEGIINIAVAKDSVGQKVVYVMKLSAYDVWGTPKFYKTTDLGDNWEEITHPYTSFATEYDPDVFMIDPNNSNTIYMGARSFDTKILRYKSDEDKWSAIQGAGLGSSWSTCIDISTEINPTIYLGSSYGGIYKRTIGVVTFSWTQIVSGINATYINDIAVLPSSSDLAYACVKDEYGLFKTTDSGVNWSWIKSGSPDLLAVDPQSQSVLYAADNNQNGNDYFIQKSTNSGSNWQQIKFYSCTGLGCSTKLTDILIHPNISENILVATKMRWLSSQGLYGFGGIFRKVGSNDWDVLSPAGSAALALDPNNSNTLYTGKEDSGQLWKIEDCWGNPTFTEISPTDGIKDITDIELDNASNVYVSTESGLWRYTEGNWTELTLPSTYITSLAIDRGITPNMIYAATGDNGVFISNDGGTTWNVWNDGLKNFAITKLKIGGSKVWVGTEYGGVWCRNTAQSVSPSYLTHNTGDYKISIFQDGSFGHLSSLITLGEGCQYKNNVDALFASGLIFGTQSAGFVNGNQASLDIVNDFTNTEPIHEVTSLDPEMDYISETAYNDNGAIIPYGVSVHQKAFSNAGDEFVILEFGFTSASSSLDDFYAGIFADWDVGAGEGYLKNLGGYDQSRNLAYQYVSDGAPDPNYYGVVALSGMVGAKVTTEGGAMRETALQRISTFENETITEIGDYRMWIGSGPFTLTQGVTKYVSFAFVAGTDLANLQANADAAAQKYQHIITDVGENEVFLTQFRLSQNYPNPFNSTTLINYQIPRGSKVTLEIFDFLGRRVKILVDEYKKTGNYKIEFNSKNLSSGTYFYKIKTVEFSDVKKMLLLK
jgi:photosystem II stability/assembly factor-like uncharacterized protein